MAWSRMDSSQGKGRIFVKKPYYLLLSAHTRMVAELFNISLHLARAPIGV